MAARVGPQVGKRALGTGYAGERTNCPKVLLELFLFEARFAFRIISASNFVLSAVKV